MIQDCVYCWSTIASEGALANRHVNRRDARCAEARTGHSGHYSSTRPHHANARVFVVGNVDVSITIDYRRNGIPEKSVDGQPVIAAETGGRLTRNRLNRPALRSQFPNARPGTGKIEITSSVDGDPRGTRDSCVDAWPSVPAIHGGARSRYRRDNSRRGVHSPDPIVVTIGNVDVPGGIQRYGDRFADRRIGCLTAIAAVSQDSGARDCSDRAISYPDFQDEAAPVRDVNISPFVDRDAGWVV